MNNDTYHSLYYNVKNGQFKAVEYSDDSLDNSDDYRLLMSPLPHDFILSFLEHYFDKIESDFQVSFEKAKRIFLDYFVDYGFSPPQGEREFSIKMPVSDWCKLVVVGDGLSHGVTFEEYSLKAFKNVIDSIEDNIRPQLGENEGTDIIDNLIYDTYIYTMLGNDPIAYRDVVKSFQYNHLQKMFHFADNSDLTHAPGWIELGINVPMDKAQGYTDLYYDHVLDHESERMVIAVFKIWMDKK